MAISWKTYQKHNKLWNTVTSRLNQETNAEDPEHYFKDRAMRFDPDEFIGKHRGTYETRGGLNLQDFYLSVAEELMSEVSYWCDDAVEYMKANHPWNNRTHAAEEGLGAMIAGIEEDKIVIYLYHSVYYGVYLEERNFPHAGRLEIIRPTLQQFAPQLTRNLQGLLDRS